MDARSTVPGLDTPQTRQRFAPGLTSAPQRLQRKARTTAACPVSFYLEQFADALIPAAALARCGCGRGRLLLHRPGGGRRGGRCSAKKRHHDAQYPHEYRRHSSNEGPAHIPVSFLFPHLTGNGFVAKPLKRELPFWLGKKS
jgi:hypothetical protein